MVTTKPKDNSGFDEKVRLRLDNLPDKRSFKILDCYCGSGRIWKAVALSEPKVRFSVLSIDQKPKTDQLHLIGDNLRFLKSVNLKQFDAIDLDAYGSPLKQLAYLFVPGRLNRGTVLYVTFIQAAFGQLPHWFLSASGFTRSMIEKAPTLCSKGMLRHLFNWLHDRGVRRVKMYSSENKRKNYLCFEI